MRSKGHHKKAEGGRAKDHPLMEGKDEHLYNAKGAPEASEEEDEKPGFKKGGKAKREHHREGGHVEGKEPEHRPDKAPRGHHKRKAGGRTPYSSGSQATEPEKSVPGMGHESVRPKMEPD